MTYLLDDFNKATQKLRQAEDTSDLQSDAETQQRRRIKTKKMSLSSSDEEIIETLERPPKIARKTTS